MSDSHKGVRLHVRVSPSKKEEWMDSLDEGETLTSLVTNAVDHELSNEYVHVDAVEGLTGGDSVEVDVSGITDQLDEIQATVSAVHREIDDVSVQVSKPDESRIQDLAMDVITMVPRYRDLPTNVLNGIDAKVPSGADADEQRAVRLRVLPQAIEKASKSQSEPDINGSAYKIGVDLDADSIVVRQALIYLERRTTENVHSVVADGTRHWFRGV